MNFNDLANCEFNDKYNLQFAVKSDKDLLKALEEGKKKRKEIHSLKDLKEHITQVRKNFKEVFGRELRRDQLQAEVKSTTFYKKVKIENVLLKTGNRIITGNFYIPEGNGKFPAILFCSGHYNEARMNPNYFRVCCNFALNGFAVLAFDPIGQGERRNYVNSKDEKIASLIGVDEHFYEGTQSLPTGVALVSYFLEDSLSALDYLFERDEVDKENISVAGNSGGGTQTATLMLYGDERVKNYVIATYITDMATNIKNNIVQDCEQIFYGLCSKGFDHADFLLAGYDKSVKILLAKQDFFAVEGAYDTLREVNEIYSRVGINPDLLFFEDDCLHCYSDNMIKGTVGFLFERCASNRKLQFDACDNFDVSCLTVCSSGQVLKDFPFAETVEDQTRKTLAKKTSDKDDNTIKRFLFERVFYNRKPVAFTPELLKSGVAEGWKFEQYAYFSQEDVSNIVTFFYPQKNNGKMTLFLFENGTASLNERKNQVISYLKEGTLCAILDLDGLGNLQVEAQNEYFKADEFMGEIGKIANNLFWIGDSIVALHAYEILCFADFAKQQTEILETEIYAEDKVVPAALIANYVSDAFSKVRCEKEFFASYREFCSVTEYKTENIPLFIMPSILNYTDLPLLKCKCTY